MNSKIFLMSSACFFQEELPSPFSRAMADERGARGRGGRAGQGAQGRPSEARRGAGAGAAGALRQSFLSGSFLFHSRRRRGPSLALISARLGHRLPAAAAARPAPSPRAASLTFCYFLASLRLLPAARLLPPPRLLPRAPRPPRAARPPPRLPRAAAFGDVLHPRARGAAAGHAPGCRVRPGARERAGARPRAGAGRRGARAGGARPLGCFIDSAKSSLGGARAFLPGAGGGASVSRSAAARRGGAGLAARGRSDAERPPGAPRALAGAPRRGSGRTGGGRLLWRPEAAAGMRAEVGVDSAPRLALRAPVSPSRLGDRS